MFPAQSVGLPAGHAAVGTYYGRRVHLVGIGGSGMRNVAVVLLRQGAQVSGSDRQAGEATLRLQALGAQLSLGEHDAEHLPEGTELVVASPAVPPDNPELREARRRGLEIIPYAELVGRLMAKKVGIAIAGTHGKSTTTAMTALALRAGEKDPTFVVGAEVEQLGGGSGVGCGPHFVVEACEYRRSFHQLRPRLAVILNIEEDHLDYYRNLEEVCSAFGAFARLVPTGGMILVNADDPVCMKATAKLDGRREQFALRSQADWRARRVRRTAGCYGFDVDHLGYPMGRVQLRIPGLHNVYNALAAFALAWHGGAANEKIIEALNSFRGCDRRLSCLGAGRGVTLLDDFAHHPTEIRASLLAARQRYHPKRLWVVFQPHQHSRTRFLLEHFARSFSRADYIIVPDIYFVRDSELERARIGAEDLVSRIRAHGSDARHVPDFDRIVEHLGANVIAGDLVVTMGAGDVWKVADELLFKLGIDGR